MQTERADVERALADRLAKLHREEHGVLPDVTSAHLCGDLAIVRMRGVFTGPERAVLAEEGGRKRVALARHEHRSLVRRKMHAAVADVLGCEPIRSFFDLDARTGDAAEVYVMECDLGRRFA